MATRELPKSSPTVPSQVSDGLRNTREPSSFVITVPPSRRAASIARTASSLRASETGSAGTVNAASSSLSWVTSMSDGSSRE